MELTVKQLKNRDPGSGMAVIDRDALQTLGLSSGDFVRISGYGDDATARVWPSDANDAGSGVIRIDGQLRRAADVGIGDRVTVEKTEVEPADRITVALPQNLPVRGDLRSHLREQLVDQAVTAGQTVAFEVGFGMLSSRSGRRIPLTIADTEPSGTVVVGNSTEIRVAKRPAEEISVDSESLTEASAPGVTYEDIGGLDDELERVREMIELPMRHPELIQTLGIEPPKGVLLHGPPGTGKTLIARAVANEIDAEFETISGPEIMSKYYGESEEQLRDVFEEAEENAPAIVFIDELDSIAPKRENAPTVVFFDEIDGIAAQRGQGTGDSNVGERVVSQLLTELDGLEALEDVVVIATTNRLDLIDDALLRPGRLDRHVAVGEPDEAARREIFEIHTREKPLADDVDLDELVERTEDYVGADIEAICREAAQIAVREYVQTVGSDAADSVDEIELTMTHFEQALDEVDSSVGPETREFEEPTGAV